MDGLLSFPPPIADSANQEFEFIYLSPVPGVS